MQLPPIPRMNYRAAVVVGLGLCSAIWLLYAVTKTRPSDKPMPIKLVHAQASPPPPSLNIPPPLPEPPPMIPITLPSPVQQPSFPEPQKESPPPAREPQPQRDDPRKLELAQAIKSPLRVQGMQRDGNNTPQVLEIGATQNKEGKGGNDYTITAERIPSGPYTLRTGFGIPIRLETAIDSRLPGMVVGTVTQDIFDSIQHSWLLIPQATRVIGRYDHNIQAGQGRLPIRWQRLQFVDGTNVVLPDGMPSTDNQGTSGISGTVDNHLGAVFTKALLLTMVGSAINLGQTQGSYSGAFSGYNATNVIGNSASNEMGQVSREIIENSLNQPPTITVPVGEELLLLADRDIRFTRPFTTATVSSNRE